MADTSVVFNILAKDKTGKVFNDIKGKMAAAFGAAALVSFGKQAVDAASNLVETQSKVAQIFGDSSGAINAFAADAASSLGQSKQQALDAAATFAIFGKSAGLQGPALSGFSTQLTGLATDLASFHNTSPQEAIEAIGAALRGEAEPIQKYGVLLNDATLRNQALRMGLIKTTTQALTPQQKVLAAQAVILAQTKDAQGDFAKTSGGLANQQRIMAAEVENAKAKIGTGLLPVILQVTHALVPLIDFISRNTGWILPLVAGIAAIVGVIKIWTAVQWLLNFAMTANPIGLIIVGIGILIGVIIWLATKTQFFQTIWAALWGFLKGVGAWFAGPFAGFFVNAWNAIINGVKNAQHWVIDRLTAIVHFVTSLPGKITAAAKNMWTGLVNTARAAFNVLIRAWNSLDFGIHINIPSWVPGIGGKGLNINDIIPDIPYLAKGGIVTGPTLAMLGEGGHPERVQPLDGSQDTGRDLHLTLNLDFGDGLKKTIRKIVRTDGGGNVQTAFGI